MHKLAVGLPLLAQAGGTPNFFVLFLALAGLVCLGAVAGLVILLVVASRRRPTPRPKTNLIECPDCGRRVSPRAASCPQCGRPFEPVAE